MKLLDRVRHAARVKHFSYRTEQAYVSARAAMPASMVECARWDGLGRGRRTEGDGSHCQPEEDMGGEEESDADSARLRQRVG